MSILQYQEDSDFEETFKNLLKPIESITKIECEIFQYDFIKVINNNKPQCKKKNNNMLYYL